MSTFDCLVISLLLFIKVVSMKSSSVGVFLHELSAIFPLLSNKRNPFTMGESQYIALSSRSTTVMLFLLIWFLGFSLISFLCDLHWSLSNFILNLSQYSKSYKRVLKNYILSAFGSLCQKIEQNVLLVLLIMNLQGKIFFSLRT